MIPKTSGIENIINPILYLRRLTVAGGPYFLNQEKIDDLRNAKPDFPRMATAISINISGIPNAKTSEIIDFIPVEISRVRTHGISKGTKKPDTKIIPPQIKRPFGGTSVVTLLSSVIFL